MTGETRRRPWAEQQQQHSDHIDTQLTARARQQRPTVAWWWGRRRAPGGSVAVCYICGETITRISLLTAVTEPEQLEIVVHRGRHALETPHGTTTTDRGIHQ